MTERLLGDAAQTAALGAAIARGLAGRAGGVIHLIGPLGAGKTTLARGLLRELGVTGTIRSPTYTLLEPYEIGGRTLIHLDLYRLNDERELEPLGLRDYPPERCWWLVEWPDRGGARLPSANLRVELLHVPDGRIARLTGEALAALPFA
ncbi:MAG TPA: tRNA (adenosine(37)-N6)-threonylcarbamoyltransferase complex ATPase subunit type 1 TsaE [Verrucomicrobiae bacterium]|nr:tRNA (adenosine(37)-N6)-threonylcarbamoyltransferase complex ATPase subunit type 1 TsaE [Verrucomicrobiae bacterium]